MDIGLELYRISQDVDNRNELPHNKLTDNNNVTPAPVSSTGRVYSGIQSNSIPLEADIALLNSCRS